MARLSSDLVRRSFATAYTFRGGEGFARDRLGGLMFRIRRIYDDTLPVDRDAIRQVQEILSTAIEGVHAKDVEQLPERLRNPTLESFLNILFVAEKPPGKVQGFALLLHDPELRFA